MEELDNGEISVGGKVLASGVSKIFVTPEKRAMGMAANPFSRKERLENFYGCVIPSLTHDQADEVIALVEGMAGLDNIHRLMEIVCNIKGQ